MELYAVITVLDRSKTNTYLSICSELDLPMTVTMLGRGTAAQEYMVRYDLSETEKAVILCTATSEKAQRLIRNTKKKLMIDIPGNGIMMTVPVKSVGGGKTLTYLTNNAADDSAVPKMEFEHELLIVILNQSYVDDVMEAARSAGASGGTVLHAKGTGADYARRFLGVTLASEKEVILITARASEKAAIMRAIVEKTGPDTPAGAIVFSLPVSSVAGLRNLEE